MKHVVGIGDMKVSACGDDIIVTHGLGSCLGICAHDPAAGVGGLLHVMMPQSSVNPQKASANPFMFVDTGVPAFFREIYAAGALKQRLVVKVAGGAASLGGEDHFAVGKRNYIMLKKMFWQNGILIKSEDVGGAAARTMFLYVGTGKVWLNMAGEDREL